MGSAAILLATPLAVWLGRDVARVAFVLTPEGCFAAVAAQRFSLLLYYRRFDMGEFRIQPLMVQTGSLTHDFADYDIGLDALHHQHNYQSAGAQVLIASSASYRGASSYVFVKIPLWMLLILAMPAPALAMRRVMIARRRRRRGLCLACGYDLRASAGRCPECGTAASPAGG